MQDINEFAPVFSSSAYSTTALNTAPANTSLLQVLATDEDGNDNTITYSIVNPNENGISFSVDSDGVITNDEEFPRAAGTMVRPVILI